MSGPVFTDIDDDVWRCPHEASPDANRCVFHADPGATTAAAPAERLRELVETRAESIRIIGARLASLSLDYVVLDGPSNHPIDAREAVVDGSLSLAHATVKRPLWLDGLSVGGPVSFKNAGCHRELRLRDASLEGPVTIGLADVSGWLDASDCDFQDHVYGRVARFRHGIVAENARFRGAADFVNADFEDVANFYGVTFERGAVFNSAVFEGSARFDEAAIEAPATKLRGSSGSAIVSQSPGTLEGTALSMRGVRCEKNLELAGATVGGDVLFADVEIARDINTVDIDVPAASLFDCRGTRSISGSLDSAGGAVKYDLTDATLSDITLAGASTIGDLRFDRTRFDGFDFGLHKRTLAERDWTLHDEGNDASAASLENLYLRAKNGAKDVGETRAAGKFFIHEMRYRRTGHRERLARSSGIKEWFGSAGQLLGNTALAVTCGYGERPFRPVVFSVGVIVAFASLYAVPAPDIVYPQPFGYLLFSAEAFVSLIVGLPEAVGTGVSLLVITEAFVGGFAIALFVFTLTRSVSR